MQERKGWLEATAFVVAIGALSLVYAIGHALGAHPIAFILYAMTTAAAATLAAVGFGPAAAAIVRHPLSWVVGLSIILIEVFYFQTLAYVAPAHGNLVLRISIPIAMLAGWALFGRRPLPLSLVGGAVIVLATAFAVALAPAGTRWPMALAGTLAGAFMVVRGFAAEFHPMNRDARTVHDKLRFTGVVVLVTSAMSLVLVAAAALAVAGGAIPATRLLPTAAQMLHVPTIALGCVAGGAVLTLMMYLNFSSVVAIGTANITAMMAFSPATTWAFQELGVALGWIDARRPDGNLVASIVACIAGVLLIFWADVRARRAVQQLST